MIPRLNMSTLYREKFPYEVPMARVTFNHLLLARMYFDDARFMKVMQARLDANHPVLEAMAWMAAGNPRAWIKWLKQGERRSVDEVVRYVRRGLVIPATRRRDALCFWACGGVARGGLFGGGTFTAAFLAILSWTVAVAAKVAIARAITGIIRGQENGNA